MPNFKQEKPISVPALQINDDLRKEGTDSSQAITQSGIKGKIISSTTNLGGSTSEDITLTNPNIRANSLVLVQVSKGGAGTPVVSKVGVSDGQAVIKIYNAGSACDAAYELDYVIL